ncbi:hypothetical protein [Actinomadura rugatobispora]|uniref:Uncharacterized protein n=1 Tax=Actinomadura rugatobispora TaxID=1994 RepID=A0ABW0ZSN8_9ACTN|nr:hypothetical protein GCM10010200_042940 [Actinomadura rugatobispora]
MTGWLKVSCACTIGSDYLLHTHHDRLRASRQRQPGRPLMVLTAQTIEVGANIEVNALVTESAPLPALIQRLSTLDTSPAPVVDDPTTGDDPMYSTVRAAT